MKKRRPQPYPHSGFRRPSSTMVKSAFITHTPNVDEKCSYPFVRGRNSSEEFEQIKCLHSIRSAAAKIRIKNETTKNFDEKMYLGSKIIN